MVDRDGCAATYTYDALGRRASKSTAAGREYYLYNGNELVAVADHQGRVRSEYLYQGYRPVAWLMDATAYRLRTDHRGAVLAAVPASATGGSPAWESGIDAWGAVRSGAGPDPKLRLVGQYADEETGLSYHLARYYDPKRGRFISPDPAGVADSIDNSTPAALLLDTTAYAGGQPLEYFDPDGAARIRYYAITTGANGRALGTTQGFTRARWAFIVDDIQSGGDGSALGQMRNRYASNGTGLLFDANGNFLANGQSTATWNGGGGIPSSFVQHYGNNLISIAQFTIDNMDDDDATALIASYIEADRQQVFGNGCPARAALLPAIRFAPGEADINVWREAEPPVNGTPDSQANRQRIINCNRPSSTPVNYANDEERRRIVKYEAAAELQESPATSEIYKDCSNNHGCRSGTAITVNGHSYYASYGRTQFVTETFLRTLISSVINDRTVTAAQRSRLRLNQPVTLPSGRQGTMADMVRIAAGRAEAAGVAFRDLRTRFGTGLTVQQGSAAWNSLTPQRQAGFLRDTGLTQSEFIDMLAFVPDGRARTNAEAQNAFGSEAALRLLDGNGQPVFRDWLMWLYSSQDEYDFVSKTFLKENLNTVLMAPTLQGRFTNSEQPGSDAHRLRQRQIEDELAQRVAILHNAGSGSRHGTAVPVNPPPYLADYAREFLRVAGRGDWRSLRCSYDLNDRPGIQLQRLRIN